ncbi:unnamed protein product [Merluccius merluccius]
MPITNSGKESVDTRMVEEEGDMESEPNSAHSPQKHFDASSKAQERPLAPDVFLPNSVMRSWGEEEDPPRPTQPDRLRALDRTFSLTEHQGLPPEITVVRVKTTVLRPVTINTKAAHLVAEINLPDGGEEYEEHNKEEEEGKGDEKEEEEGDPIFNLLKSISLSPWLVKKPECFDLDEVVVAVLSTMEVADCGVYQKCTETLMHLAGTLDFPQELLQKNVCCFLQHAQQNNPHWKRVGGMNNLQAFLPRDQSKDYLQELTELRFDKCSEISNISKEILSTIQTKTHLLNHIKGSNNQTANNDPGRDQGSIPEWRENLYRLIYLHGFRSPWAAKLAAREHLGNLCAPSPRVPPILQPPQLSQQVTTTTWWFHHQVSLDSKLGSLTLD